MQNYRFTGYTLARSGTVTLLSFQIIPSIGRGQPNWPLQAEPESAALAGEVQRQVRDAASNLRRYRAIGARLLGGDAGWGGVAWGAPAGIQVAPNPLTFTVPWDHLNTPRTSQVRASALLGWS